MDLAQDAERDKWEAVYRDLSAEQVMQEGGAVYVEIADLMAGLLPAGGRVLEAACGSGRHSVELARRGGFHTTLLDFSPNAIACARRVFAHCQAGGEFIIGDIFNWDAQGGYDLVFNSGVLEHYAFDRQVEMLKAMARRSRRLVLVLVPNRECYWYWIYRIHHAAAGMWPFGCERPASSYADAIRAAGMHFLGTTWLGAEAVCLMIEHLDGITPDLKKIIIETHRHQIAPIAQRSYFVGFLASVRPEAGEFPPFTTSASFDQGGKRPDDWTDRCTALAADALALQIAALHRERSGG